MINSPEVNWARG